MSISCLCSLAQIDQAGYDVTSTSNQEALAFYWNSSILHLEYAKSGENWGEVKREKSFF